MFNSTQIHVGYHMIYPFYSKDWEFSRLTPLASVQILSIYRW